MVTPNVQIEDRKDQLPLNTLEFKKEQASKESELNHPKTTLISFAPKWESISVNNMPIQSVKTILDVEAKRLQKKKTAGNIQTSQQIVPKKARHVPLISVKPAYLYKYKQGVIGPALVQSRKTTIVSDPMMQGPLYSTFHHSGNKPGLVNQGLLNMELTKTNWMSPKSKPKTLPAKTPFSQSQYNFKLPSTLKKYDRIKHYDQIKRAQAVVRTLKESKRNRSEVKEKPRAESGVLHLVVPSYNASQGKADFYFPGARAEEASLEDQKQSLSTGLKLRPSISVDCLEETEGRVKKYLKFHSLIDLKDRQNVRSRNSYSQAKYSMLSSRSPSYPPEPIHLIRLATPPTAAIDNVGSNAKELVPSAVNH